MINSKTKINKTKDQPAKTKYRLKIVTGDMQHRCSGCRVCEMVCSLSHEGECNTFLSRIHVERDFFTGKFQPKFCLQCVDSQCFKACQTEGAFTVDKNTGAIKVDSKNCDGCGFCIDACKFNMIFMNKDKKVAFKCDLCSGNPKCVEFCPSGIIKLVEVKEK